MTDRTQEPGNTPDQPDDANVAGSGDSAAPDRSDAAGMSAEPETPTDASQSADAQPAAAAPADAQPTEEYPRGVASDSETAAYPTDAFGRPIPGPDASNPGYGAPTGAEQPYASENGYPTQQFGPAPSTKEPARRKGSAAIIAALAIGALVGGASGAAVTGLVLAGQGGSIPASQAEGPSSVVVNNTDSVNEITAVAAKAAPSVVTISVSTGNAGGSGSGVILSEDGYVLTNTHVVTLDGAAADAAIQVTASDGKLYKATLVGTDPVSDLAVIKLTDAKGLTPIKWADSAKLNVGDAAIAIGAPLGLAGTVTNGIVSALNRSITVASSAAPETPDDTAPEQEGQDPFDFWNFDIPNEDGSAPDPTQSAKGSISLPVIQTDAAINPGNSGGALLNGKGELIGINVAIANAGGDSSTAAGSIGVGFAIPSSLAERVADELIANGTATHGLLGATVTSAAADPESTTVGALIRDVSSGGAAEKAGLEAGDVVTNFNGVPITDANDLTAQVRALAAGDSADLTYVRDGKSVTVTVTVGELSS